MGRDVLGIGNHSGGASFGGEKFGALVYQTYSSGSWSQPKVLVYPNMSGYFIYYHHLTIDRVDNLHLKYSRWSLQEPYCRTGGPANNICLSEILPQFYQPALLKSANRGGSWYLATDRDIQMENNKSGR